MLKEEKAVKKIQSIIEESTLFRYASILENKMAHIDKRPIPLTDIWLKNKAKELSKVLVSEFRKGL